MYGRLGQARTRLAEAVEADGSIGEEAVDRLVAAVTDAVAESREREVDELVAFATSAVRGAVNRPWIAARLRVEAGLDLGFLDGPDEARPTFLAARRWSGWSAGPLLLMDMAPKAKAGPYVGRTLRRDRLREEIPELARRKARRRARMRGASENRAAQILAGAIAAEATMAVLDLAEADICPWAVREGVICHRMAAIPAPAAGDLHDLLETRPEDTRVAEPRPAPESATAVEAAELTARDS